MSVRKYSERITARVLALSEQQQRDAIEGLKAIYAGSVKLRTLPIELFLDIGGALVELVVATKVFRQKPRALAEDILRGSPPLAASAYAVEIRAGAAELEALKHGKKAHRSPAGQAA